MHSATAPRGGSQAAPARQVLHQTTASNPHLNIVLRLQNSTKRRGVFCIPCTHGCWVLGAGCCKTRVESGIKGVLTPYEVHLLLILQVHCQAPSHSASTYAIIRDL